MYQLLITSGDKVAGETAYTINRKLILINSLIGKNSLPLSFHSFITQLFLPNCSFILLPCFIVLFRPNVGLLINLVTK